MSKLTVQQEREYVEAHGVCSVHGLPLSKTPWWGYADNRHKRGWEFETEDEAIHAAYLFTLARLEEIRQIEEEIATQSEFCQHGDECGLCAVVARTVARLQAALDELKRGMTAGGCNGR
jgi:hypothetical protein